MPTCCSVHFGFISYLRICTFILLWIELGFKCSLRKNPKTYIPVNVFIQMSCLNVRNRINRHLWALFYHLYHGYYKTPCITVSFEISLIIGFCTLISLRSKEKYFDLFIATNAFCFRLHHPSWRTMALQYSVFLVGACLRKYILCKVTAVLLFTFS